MDRIRVALDRLRYGFYRRAGLNLRKRRTFRRLVGHLTEPIVRLARVSTGREQHLDVSGHDLVLPPEHRLPYYRRRDTFYDVHAAALLAALADGAGELRVIDVGANVGDTAASALGAAPNITVVAVEGNPAFARYARRNLASFGDRAEVRETFVGPIHGVDAVYRTSGEGSGAFVVDDGGSDAPIHWVSPGDLIAGAGAADLVVWKSDIDGFDIHVLAEHWEPITDACRVVWFEYDPVGTLGDPAEVAALVDRIGASGRGMIVFDNLGNRLVAVAPTGDTAATLRDLTGWLYAQRAGHIMVRYFDVWLVAADLWPAVATVGLQPNPATTAPGPG